MHNIFYGIAGEGLGHVSRALSVIEALPDCRVHIFTHGDAYRYLSNRSTCYLHEILGLEYAYSRGRVSLFKSAAKNAHFIAEGMAFDVRYVEDMARMYKPSLFITDYEPVVSRAAKRCGIPCISIDNQHSFSHCSVRKLPLANRWHAMTMGSYGNWLIPYKNEVVVSTFHRELLVPKRTDSSVSLVDSIVRKEVRDQEVRNDGHGLVYVRKAVHQEQMLRSLDGLDMPIKVYGANVPDALDYSPRCTFHALGPDFIRDMATCDWVMGTAGHQLVSEAKYLGKRMLMIPEPGQPEQAINSHYADQLRIGQKCQLRHLTPDVLRQFLQNVVPREERGKDGTPQVVEIIRRYLD